jgi:hypothetical protein
MATPGTPPRAIGLAVAAAQLALALSWTVYVVFLPTLAAQAGLPPQAVLWLLIADQAVFLVADYACGVASDRMLALHRRLAPALLAATAVSAAAFLVLPWLAPQGSPVLLVVVTLVWTLTSSVLRAPPMNLIGRHASRPAQPAMVALAMLGLGLAAAVAPWLALVLKGVDPRAPFALASLGVLAAAGALAWAEGQVAKGASAAPASSRAASATAAPAPTVAPLANTLLLLAAALLAALAFQWHGNLNSVPQWRRFVPAEQLPLWLPVFWAGFNLALWPAMKLAPKLGELRLVAGASVVAAVAAAVAAIAPSLPVLAAAQALAGAAWAALMAGGFMAALALGHTGREGRLSGAVSSSLAGAAMLRLVGVSSGLAVALREAAPGLADALPVLLWGVAAALLLLAPRPHAAAPRAAA